MPHIVVIGGGIAGLAAAWRLVRASGPGEPIRVSVTEAGPRFGGKIITERREGFLLEGGPDSFAVRKPRGLGLVRELGLEASLIPTAPNGDRGRVHLVRDGRLVPLPEGLSLVVPTRPGAVVRSPLLSAGAKLRLAFDLVLPRHGRTRGGTHPRGSRNGAPGGGEDPFAGTDESVASLLRRRFGAEYLERVAGPLLAGIHSTDPEELSVEAAFPHLAALERRHRSLLLGARRGGSTDGAGPVSDRSAGPGRASLAGGMGELVDTLVARLRSAGAELHTSRRAVALEPGGDGSGGGWTIHCDGGPPLGADAVVLASPPRAVARLVRDLGPESARSWAAALEAIPHASSATVSLGFPRSAVGGPLEGLGFLVPRSEGRRLSACTFSSEKFPGRAPAGHVLLRAFVGGARGGELAQRDDEALTALACEELDALLGVKGAPVVARVHRFVGANPQYRVGHLERVRGLERATPPGLILAGCAYRGLGIPDCIASGEGAADAALEAVAGCGFTADSSAR